jgi:hypothetical protein
MRPRSWGTAWGQYPNASVRAAVQKNLVDPRPRHVKLAKLPFPEINRITECKKVGCRLFAALQMYVRKVACLAFGLAGAVNLSAQLAAPTYDLSRDFPSLSNPAGVWSLGWKPSLGGPFTLLTYDDSQSDPSGGIWEYWLRTSSAPTSVYRNSGAVALTSDGAGRPACGQTQFRAGPLKRGGPAMPPNQHDHK